MISLEDFKALLGPLALTLTDEEIVELRTMEYQFADAVIEWWLRNGTGRNVEPSDDGQGSNLTA